MLAAADHVLCVGAVVSRELYGVHCPVVVATANSYAGLTSGDIVAVCATESEGTLQILARCAASPRSRQRLTERSAEQLRTRTVPSTRVVATTADAEPNHRLRMEMSSCTDKSGLVTELPAASGRAIVLDLAADGANVRGSRSQ